MLQYLPRHEIWRRNYREFRYCKHLSRIELNARIRDILVVMLALTPDAQIGLVPFGQQGGYWLELWTHVLEEMVLRYGPYPAGFARDILHSEPFPDFVGSIAQRAARVLQDLPAGKVAIKFGKPEHMCSLYERGALRIQPASFYSRPDHNGAVRDDELALGISLTLNRDDIVKIVANPGDVPSRIQDQRIDVTYKSQTDYWLYCLTTSVQSRIFVDFNAEACVVIKDIPRFVNAIDRAFAPYAESAELRHGNVKYIDPLRPQTPVIDVPMSKHFRYAYQQEYRCVWFPVQQRGELKHIDVELGGLQDYADLIILPSEACR
jgi:hypothetical protein